MKKSFVFILAAYLLLNTMGYQVFAHYCGNNLKSSSLIFKSSEPCCESEIDMDLPADDCCKDKSQFVQLKDHYLKLTTELSFAKSVSILFFEQSIIHFATFTESKVQKVIFNYPPGFYSVSKSISFCVFKI